MSEATAASLLTVAPAPGTSRPSAPRSAYVEGSNGDTITTATSVAEPAAGAPSASVATATRSPAARLPLERRTRTLAFMPGPTGTDSIRVAAPAGRLRPLPSPLAREALLCAFGAAGLAALLVWLGPPGTDLAAHAYQRALLLKHGFSLWNNFWYAGRYSFVTYSIAYYPLAALFGIKPLAVTTVAAAALAFAILLEREWGATARWSGRTFAVVWAGIVLSAALPFTLGIALALLALCALQARGRWRFAALAVATLAASPVAFVLLVLLVGGIALARRQEWRRFGVPAVAIASAAAFEAALWRIFPDPGRFPFSAAELASACP